MLFTNIALLVFIGVAFVCIVLTLFAAICVRSRMHKSTTEDSFIIYAPMLSLNIIVFFVFTFGSIASLAMFFIPTVGNFALLLWVIFFMAMAFSLYFIYGAIYYMSFEAHIYDDEIIHKELFYPEFRVKFKHISKASYSSRMGNKMLILYSDTENILEAEDHFVGYDLLIERIKGKGIIQTEN